MFPTLGFIFDPLLASAPVISVTIFAIVVLILINLCYKFLVNQQEAKQIKDRTKELNEMLKKEQKEGNKEKVSQLMSEVMKENSKMMKMTMKPMLVSFIIIILFLPWLSGNYGDQTVKLVDNKGNITIDNELYYVQMNGEEGSVIKESATVISFISSSSEEERRFQIGDNYYVISYEEAGGFIFTNPEQVKFAKVVALLPEGMALPLFGNEFGWLGWYLIVSIPLMILIRKILKINV